MSDGSAYGMRARVLQAFSDLRVDLRYATRVLRASPGFAAAAILTLAVGIGANTAVFSLVHAVLLAYLPVDRPEELVVISHSSPERNGSTFPYLFFRELDSERHVLEGVLSRGGSERVTFGADAGGEPAIGELVSGSFFDVLGITPAAGRLLTRNDDVVPGGHPVVVLSHAFWRKRFNADPGVVGRIVMVSGYPMTVVGVTPLGFDGLDPGQRVDLRIPLAMQSEVRRAPLTLQRRNAWELQIVGRLKHGVTIGQAQQAIDVRFAQYVSGDVNVSPERIVLRPAATGLGRTRAQFETALWVLMAITIAVLAIACVNLANLFAARSFSRRYELSVRAALGAGMGRLVRQLLTESVLLALCGAACGVFVAYAGAAWLAGLVSGSGSALLLENRPRVETLVFHVTVALVSGTMFGMGSILRLRRDVFAPDLRESGRTFTAARRHWLIAGQVALSIVVLVGAGLFLQTIRALRSTDLGFRPDHLLLIALDPKTAGHSDAEVVPFFRTVRERLQAVPGISDVTFSTVRALSNSTWSAAVSVDGRFVERSARALRDAVGPGYFRTLGTPLVSGRDFTEADTGTAHKVAVVNESFVRAYLRDTEPLGHKIGAERPEYTIVGVARDTRQVHVREAAVPAWYVPYEQRPGLKNLNVIMRTAGDPERITADVRTAIAAVDSGVALFEVRSQAAQIDELLITERILAMLATLFAGIAAALAALGLYGLLAFLVSQRRREIALRMALGARPSAIARTIAGDVWWWFAAGIGGGLMAAMTLGRYGQAILYGVTPADGVSMTIAALVMAAVAAAGSVLPVLRATRTDPGSVLRE